MRNIFILSLITLYFSLSTSYIKSISSLYQQQHYPQILAHKRSNKLLKMTMSDGYLNNLNIQQYINANLSRSIKETDNYNIDFRMPLTGEQINISSIYLNLDKAKGVYFSKDVKNVILTFPNNLSDIYYYDVNNNDTKGVLYRVSNNTRINMKGLKKFVFQSFNNNIDGILF